MCATRDAGDDTVHTSPAASVPDVSPAENRAPSVKSTSATTVPPIPSNTATAYTVPARYWPTASGCAPIDASADDA